ncbi:helix-turn-helix domain-containing protein [Phytohabitans houttuyneae]|uniref:AraC family transcriptional regulator n=1 Tax=Phytohabitans houttuyneae TaxID=1076126 RepID=A0A6V8JVW7_9ACTN|nr:helix-turn-helix domain-containing protein [Phytohabitans houttuyneae]GFJ76773.1 AraC family transcriptional regulator [Phytohabitans houttuyneae]
MALAFTRGRPHPRLRPYVGEYTGYVERAGGVLRRRELPGSRVVLVVGWGDPLDVAHPRATDGGAAGVASFASGLFDTYAETTLTGTGRGVQLMLDPLDAGRLFGLPAGELTNRAVPLDALPGGWADLPDRLAAQPDWPSRFAVLDEVLGARLAGAPPPESRVAWAWRRLLRARGGVAIGELAAELGWSRRHLAATFRREIGLTPKTAARVVRFQHARSHPAGGWAEVAAACGYYDQAHLIRDFREFTGATPGHIRPIALELAGAD